MRITRFSSGPNGRSQFTTVEVDFSLTLEAAGGYEVAASVALESPTVRFVVLPPDLDQDLHPAPSRQLVVVLNGALEVGTPDGQVRRFERGDIFLADDADTEGHTTRAIDGASHLLFVPIPSGTFF